jgi:hypothetical protein
MRQSSFIEILIDFKEATIQGLSVYDLYMLYVNKAYTNNTCFDVIEFSKCLGFQILEECKPLDFQYEIKDKTIKINSRFKKQSRYFLAKIISLYIYEGEKNFIDAVNKFGYFFDLSNYISKYSYYNSKSSTIFKIREFAKNLLVLDIIATNAIKKFNTENNVMSFIDADTNKKHEFLTKLSDRLEIMEDVIIDVLSYWDYFVKKIY